MKSVGRRADFIKRVVFWGVSLACLSGRVGAAEASRPNILFVLADDWGIGHAGAYGCSWVKTPAFDRVAREGILFLNAYTPNAKCAPSRSCILTGRNPWQLKAACNHMAFFPPEFKTYADALGENGYFVGTTGKGWGPGVATNAAGEPRQMSGVPFEAKTALPPATEISHNDYAANFADFLNAAPADKPWCFWFGSWEPHRAYEYGSGAARGGMDPAGIDRVPGCWPDTEIVRNDLLDYAFETQHFDRHLGRMLDALEERGQLSNTLVVVTSDNGMPFPRIKGNGYEMSNHLPLGVMWPHGITAPGRVVSDYVSLIDFAPTFIEVAGIRPSETGMAPMTGRSLTDIFNSSKSGRVNPVRDHVLIGKERHDVGRPHDQGYPIRGIVKDGQLYVENFEPSRWPAGNPETGYLNTDRGATKSAILDAHRKNPNDPYWALCFGKRPAEEFFDVRKDPDCLNNHAGNPEVRIRKEQLRQQLFAELKQQEDPRMFGNGGVFEAEPYSDSSCRGFYERYRNGEKIETPWVNRSDFEKNPADAGM